MHTPTVTMSKSMQKHRETQKSKNVKGKIYISQKKSIKNKKKSSCRLSKIQSDRKHEIIDKVMPRKPKRKEMTRRIECVNQP